jgi:hypothetical protein
MEPVGQAGLKVDETFLGVGLHIDQEKYESWIEMVPPQDDGFLAAVQRARSLGYALIPEGEDEGVLEYLPSGAIRHWMVSVFDEGEEEAAA